MTRVLTRNWNEILCVHLPVACDQSVAVISNVPLFISRYNIYINVYIFHDINKLMTSQALVRCLCGLFCQLFFLFVFLCSVRNCFVYYWGNDVFFVEGMLCLLLIQNIFFLHRDSIVYPIDLVPNGILLFIHKICCFWSMRKCYLYRSFRRCFFLFRLKNNINMMCLFCIYFVSNSEHVLPKDEKFIHVHCLFLSLDVSAWKNDIFWSLSWKNCHIIMNSSLQFRNILVIFYALCWLSEAPNYTCHTCIISIYKYTCILFMYNYTCILYMSNYTRHAHDDWSSIKMVVMTCLQYSSTNKPP